MKGRRGGVERVGGRMRHHHGRKEGRRVEDN